MKDPGFRLKYLWIIRMNVLDTWSNGIFNNKRRPKSVQYLTRNMIEEVCYCFKIV